MSITFKETNIIKLPQSPFSIDISHTPDLNPVYTIPHSSE
ncbi:hypothetical protein M7I_7392 [Glarea lozoyensis 74030]|uniref:Uncharacterized protein n=1 Tax=Glarea lozoyensis (strain ATCC 74030 / MF5533) TaxID=1104152 RepID=H0EX65_GLAL7|nr:hypothetical protein M7I_7392 [Glarea lozoyensis 74030]